MRYKTTFSKTNHESHTAAAQLGCQCNKRQPNTQLKSQRYGLTLYEKQCLILERRWSLLPTAEVINYALVVLDRVSWHIVGPARLGHVQDPSAAVHKLIVHNVEHYAGRHVAGNHSRHRMPELCLPLITFAMAFLTCANGCGGYLLGPICAGHLGHGRHGDRFRGPTKKF